MEKLRAAQKRLGASYAKARQLQLLPEQLSDDELEVWESFIARLGRVIDLYLQRVLRAQVLASDPGFSGTLRDLLNYAVKHGWIENANVWLELRELRNVAAHEYSDDKLPAIFASALRLAPIALAAGTSGG